MTTTSHLAAAAAPSTTSESRLRTLLLVDGIGTIAVGGVPLLLAGPISDHVGSVGVLRAVGLLFVVVGADMLLSRRLRGRPLAKAALLLAAVDLLWAAGTTATLPLMNATGTGTALVLAVVAICLVMGPAKIVLSRRIG